ncbi:MAG: DUF167 family protein [Nitrospirota bacterium]
MNSLIVQDTKDGAILTVHIQPKASTTECVGIHGDALKIRVAAPPIDGAANDELIRFLARTLSLPLAAVHIESGISGRHKRVRLRGVMADRVIARLMQKGPDRMKRSIAYLVCGMFLLSACSSVHPVLYPNAHMQSVGKEAATQDIEDCKKLAESAGAEEGSGKAGRVATGTVVGGGVGAAAGAVGGAISGSVGRGSMIGAATGAVWGLLTGLYHAFAGSSQPNQAYTNFVNRCLQEKGYEVTGWQ